MFCGKCGKELSEEATFCPYCGAKQGQGETKIDEDRISAEGNAVNEQDQKQPSGRKGFNYKKAIGAFILCVRE